MRVRVGVVIGLLFLASSEARAHKLKVHYNREKNGKIRVDAFYDTTNDAMTSGTIKVYRKDGSLLVEGKPDQDGYFLFEPDSATEMRVVASDGAGHAAEVHIPPDGPGGSGQGDDYPHGPPWRDVVLGVGFLLALGAFVLSTRNARAIRELRRKGA